MEPLTTALPITPSIIAPTLLTGETTGQSTSSSFSSSSSTAIADGQTTATSSSLITGTSTDGNIFSQTNTVTTNGVTTITTGDSPLMMPQSLPGTPLTVKLVVTGLPTIDVLAMSQAMATTLLLVNPASI